MAKIFPARPSKISLKRLNKKQRPLLVLDRTPKLPLKLSLSNNKFSSSSPRKRKNPSSIVAAEADSTLTSDSEFQRRGCERPSTEIAGKSTSHCEELRELLLSSGGSYHSCSTPLCLFATVNLLKNSLCDQGYKERPGSSLVFV